MSAVPASAEQARLVLERVAELAPLDIPRRSSSHRTRPGSTLPERVAITRPSSGVKPIVVSTRAAVAHRGQRRARAEVAGDEPHRRGRPASSAARRAAYACESPWKP